VEPGVSADTLATQESVSETQDDALVSEQEGSEPEWVPKGLTYPLNSKHVRGEQLQQIAEALGLPMTGTGVVTRQLIEGKLVEMGREPRNTQVVLEGSSENPAISLIDENGVICAAKPRERMTHVDKLVDTEDRAPLELCSALHDMTGKQGSLREVVTARKCELRETLETLREMHIVLDRRGAAN